MNRPIIQLRSARKLFVRIATLCIIGGLAAGAQDARPPQPVKAPAQPAAQQSSQTAPNILPPIQLDGEAALHHLNEVIGWYRHATTGIQSVGLPSDLIYQQNTQSLGAQAVRLAFQSAKAESVLIAAQQKTSGIKPESSETTQQQNLAQVEVKTSAQIDQLQSQIEGLNAQIAKTSAARKGSLISQREGLQGEVELQKALLD